jgi:hypothetical protein
MRSLSSDTQRLEMALAVEMLLSEPVRLNSTPNTRDWNGNTWLGAGSLGSVEEVRATAGAERSNLRFALSGVPSANIALALSEPLRGKPCKLWLWFCNSDTWAIVDTVQLWDGILDPMSVNHGVQTSVISVTAESMLAVFARTKELKYNESDQQRLHPGDTCMRFLASQAQHQDVWPAASYFRQ